MKRALTTSPFPTTPPPLPPDPAVALRRVHGRDTPTTGDFLHADNEETAGISLGGVDQPE